MVDKARLRQVEELLLLAQCGDASERQVEELNELLRGDAALRSAAARLLQFDAMLQEEFCVRQAANRFDLSSPTSQALSERDGAPTPTKPSGQQQSISRPLTWGLTSSWLLVVAASTIGIAIVYSMLLYTNSKAAVELARSNSRPLQALPDEPAESSLGNSMTVTYQSDTRWDGDIDIGTQITGGDVTLLRGIARLNMVQGVILILDARRSPVRIQLEPDRSVSVLQGTVLAKASDQALGFALRTPATNVVDIGTEFVVSVDTKGQSEVSVLDGAVTWLPTGSDPADGRSMLAAGSSVRFRGPTDRVGVPLTYRQDKMDELHAIAAELETDSEDEALQVHEAFDYQVGPMARYTHGQGWLGPWFKHCLPSEPPNGVIRRGPYLNVPAWLKPCGGSYAVISLASVAARKLEQPIRMNEDRELFVSFVMRKHIVSQPPDDRSGAGMSMHSDAGDQLLGVSNDMREHLTVFTGEGHYAGGKSLERDQTYFVVVKLQLRESEPDNLFAKAYTLRDPPAVLEPTQWDTVGKPVAQDGQVVELRTWCGATAIAAFDEIRVGDTWSSVVPIRN